MPATNWESTIDILADQVVEWRAAATALERERDSYRLVAQAAIHHSHTLTKELERVRRRLVAVLEERRAESRLRVEAA